MTRRPPISTRTHTLFPDTSLFRSLPFVRLSLALLFLTAWLAEMLNSQLVLAAFLAGLLLGQIVPRGSHRRERLEVIGYGFIVPFFRSEEHTSELQSLMRISYAGFCLKKKKI